MISERKIKVVFAMNDFTVGGAQRQLARQLKLYDRKNALVAADLLNDRVLPFFNLGETYSEDL